MPPRRRRPRRLLPLTVAMTVLVAVGICVLPMIHQPTVKAEGESSDPDNISLLDESFVGSGQDDESLVGLDEGDDTVLPGAGVTKLDGEQGRNDADGQLTTPLGVRADALGTDQERQVDTGSREAWTNPALVSRDQNAGLELSGGGQGQVASRPAEHSPALTAAPAPQTPAPQPVSGGGDSTVLQPLDEGERLAGGSEAPAQRSTAKQFEAKQLEEMTEDSNLQGRDPPPRWQKVLGTDKVIDAGLATNTEEWDRIVGHNLWQVPSVLAHGNPMGFVTTLPYVLYNGVVNYPYMELVTNVGRGIIIAGTLGQVQPPKPAGRR